MSNSQAAKPAQPKSYRWFTEWFDTTELKAVWSVATHRRPFVARLGPQS
jgi:hypothetical protein